ncbi:hypothetical protein [Coleofasciculus sp. F4-SAH-05]
MLRLYIAPPSSPSSPAPRRAMARLYIAPSASVPYCHPPSHYL